MDPRIKHDGYRLIVQRAGPRVRLFGHDWTDRFPRIVGAALRNRNKCFVLDGEAVLLGVDGVSDFNGLHSRKHDGYRLIVQRAGKRVRLFTRNGHDGTDRFPRIVGATLRNRNSSFVIDGEAVLLGVDGVSDFNGLHSRKHDDEVEFLCVRLPGR